MVMHNHTKFGHILGSGDSSVVRVLDLWSKGLGFESREEQWDNFLLLGQLSVLTLISVSVPPLCYHSSMWKDPVILPKVQVAGYSILNTHTPYLCGFEWSDTVNWCMVGLHRTCAQTATFHVAPAMQQLECNQYTTSVDINNTRYKKLHSFRITCDVCSESAWGQRTVLYKNYE